MPHADPKVVNALDQLVQLRFRLEATKQDIDAEYEAKQADLQTEYADKIAPIAEQIGHVDTYLWKVIQSHRQSLIKPGKQSFAIASATFQFRTLKAKLVPVNIDGIMAAARRLGVVSKIADPPTYKWTFNKQRFLAWLDNHAAESHRFGKFLQQTSGGESLSVKPNTGHVVFHDTERLTPHPFTIKQS